MNAPATLAAIAVFIGSTMGASLWCAAAVEVPQQRSSAPARGQMRTAEPAVLTLIAAAIAGDRARLDQISSQIKSQHRRSRGDRRAARELNERGLALWQRQRYADAAVFFSRAREADSANAEIAENLGYALFKAGRTADAEPAIMDALSLAPERASAWGTLGMIYAKQGRHRDGVACVLTAYRYARDRKRALDVYTRLAASDEDPRVRAMLSDVVTQLSGT